MVAHFCVDYSLFGYLLWAQPPGVMTLGSFIGLYALSQAVAGFYIHMIFMYNHQQLPMMSASKQHLRDPCFARMQVMTACNYSSHPLMSYISLGLNYQIEHHLFPELPRRNLHLIAGRVRAFCERHSMPYRVTSHWQAVKDMNKVLNHASTLPDGFPWLQHMIQEHLDCMAE